VLHANRMLRASPVRAAAHLPADRADCSKPDTWTRLLFDERRLHFVVRVFSPPPRAPPLLRHAQPPCQLSACVLGSLARQSEGPHTLQRPMSSCLSALRALLVLADAAMTRCAAAAGTSAPALRAGFGSVLLALALHRALRRPRTLTAAAAPVSVDAAVCSGGVLRASRLSLSTVGTLLASDSLTLLPGAGESLLALDAQARELYLVTQLPPFGSDAQTLAAQAAVLCLLGQVGFLRPHRALFCTTQAGRLALVRQLACDVHADGCAETLLELGRFGVRTQQLGGPGLTLGQWVGTTWPGSL